MIHYFLTEERIAYLTLLHVADKQDDVDWRNSDDGKKWKLKSIKEGRVNDVY